MTDEVILPFILVNIEITLSDEQLRDKLKEVMLSLGSNIIGEKTKNYFSIEKKKKNDLKNICN